LPLSASEKSSLIHAPDRTAKGHRPYPTGDQARLRFVLPARDLGFLVEDTRSLLGFSDEVKAPAEAHRNDVRKGIADLKQMECRRSEIVAGCIGAEAPACVLTDKLFEERSFKNLFIRVLRIQISITGQITEQYRSLRHPGKREQADIGGRLINDRGFKRLRVRYG